uniref:Uncharacterized protein n=1 Tax=Opuntia streptacantha TaxID=393608 RepID=A0A7C9AQR5_OPUST
MVFEASTSHELIDEKPLIVFTTIPNKLNQIRMMKLPKEINFSHPFSMTLKPILLQTFNSNRDPSPWLCRSCAVLFYPSLENIPKPAFSEYAVGPKVASGRFELLHHKQD